MALIFIIYAAYSPGKGGALFYDDYNNLQSLEDVKNLQSAVNFIFSGTAGPLGRPIALTSFLPHAREWPKNNNEILVVNIAIHIANAILLFWLGQIVLRKIYGSHYSQATHIAFFAALLWALIPLLASTTLIAIQRMVGLSGIFSLIGLIGFTYWHSGNSTATIRTVTWQFLSLGIATFLAIYTKENGALTPVYALLIDIAITSSPRNSKYSLIRRRLLQTTPLFILIYLSPLAHDWFAINETRQFSPWQRLETETVILWKYLYLAFLPQQPTFFGPFHDDVEIINNRLLVFLSTMSWIVVLWLSLKWFKQNRWPLLALSWFLTGHLLESTTTMLELFYEHRNYLALYGFCLAISVAAHNAKGRLAKIAPWMLSAYIILLWFILHAITIRWGQPLLASQSWVQSHPGSARAILHDTFLQAGMENKTAAELNQKFIDAQKAEIRLKLLARITKSCPDCLDAHLQGLLFACVYKKPEEIGEWYKRTLRATTEGKINESALDALFPLRELILSDSCKPLNLDSLHKVTYNLLQQSNHAKTSLLPRLFFIAAMISEDLDLLEQVEILLDRAEKSAPDQLPILQYQVHFYNKHGRNLDAKEAIDRRIKFIGETNSTITPHALESLRSSLKDQQHKYRN